MRKFYSFVLMAAALLIGTSAWAVNVANRQQLQDAIDNTPAGGTVDIKLTGDVYIGNTGNTTPIQIYAKKAETGKTVNIDLGGYQIASQGETTPHVLIELFKGTLNLKGEGSVSTKGEIAILVYGYEDPAAANWSNLTIGKDVRVEGEDEAITVTGFGGPAWNYMNTSYASKLFDGTNSVHYFNDAATYDTYKRSTSRRTDYPHSLVTAGKVDYVTHYPGYDASANYSYTYTKAYGVNIIVNGFVYGQGYGIKVNGTIKYARNSESDNIPYVHIAPTAEVKTAAKRKKSTACYSSGYGKWLIEGYVHGCIGVYIKSGELVINDAIIESDNYGDGAVAHRQSTGASSGIDGGEGSAIVIESNKNYKGGHDVTITGDTKISGANGYAMEEIISTTSTKVAEIKIEGGTFEEGANGLGAMSFTNNTLDENKVTVYGANVTGSTTVEGGATDVLATLIPSNAHITEVEIDGNKVMVVSEGPAPSEEEGNSIKNADANSSISWKNSSVTEETLEGDKKLAELQMIQDYDQTLTIPAGLTLTVDRVILGENAQIVVEAGAAFIVKGGQGIVAPSTSNIVLKHQGAVDATDRVHATFLFNPAVTSNKHPNATVELTTYSFANSASDYQWERFGVPTHNALKSISGSDVPTAFSVATLTGWQSLGYLDRPGYTDVEADVFNTPFATYELMAQRAYNPAAPTVGPKYQFAGELVGNTNATLNVNKYWTGFTNSYSASIDVPAMFDVVEAGEIITPFIYIAQPGGLGTYTWEPVDKYSDGFDVMKIAPMQAFILAKTYGSTQTEEVVLNYNDMVYEPAVPSNNPAPARRMAVNNDFTARMRVVIANEQGVWDNVQLRETAMSLQNAEKYMNDDVNIYAMSDEKDAIYSVENLEDLYLGVSTIKGGNFTISFANVEGREFDLIDLETNARIAVKEGETYSFSAAANSANDYRFKLVAPAKMPTAIENTEVKANAKGIFTLTGQFLGEMNVWNTLPAGVYVVNGAKRVK